MTLSEPFRESLAARAPLETSPYDGSDPYDETQTVVAVMGGTSRKGMWSPPGRLRVFCLMGGVSLDFREADLLDMTEVFAIGVMGGINIVVPPGVEVDADGVGLLGGFSSSSNRTRDPDAPRIRVRGLALMGGINVTIKKLPLAKRLLGS